MTKNMMKNMMRYDVRCNGMLLLLMYILVNVILSNQLLYCHDLYEVFNEKNDIAIS